MTTQETHDFTHRSLDALMTAWADQKERARQIEIMILALATAYGLPDVLPLPAG